MRFVFIAPTRDDAPIDLAALPASASIGTVRSATLFDGPLP